jgi:aryl carrier-like protein
LSIRYQHLLDESLRRCDIDPLKLKRDHQSNLLHAGKDGVRLMDTAAPITSENIGYRMLQSMGWDPSPSGTATLTVNSQTDRRGLGTS